MSTTTNKNSSKNNSKAFDGVIKLSVKNARKIEKALNIITKKQSPSFFVNSLLDKIEFTKQ